MRAVVISSYGGPEVLHVAAEQRGTEVGGCAVEQPPRRQAVTPVAQVRHTATLRLR